MMAATLTLSVFEIILLFFGAIILGITIHFFIASRKNLRETTEEMGGKSALAKDEWKLRYFNDIEVKDKELSLLKERLQESEENTGIYTMEAEEMRKENKLLKAELKHTNDANKHANAANEASGVKSQEDHSQYIVAIEELKWQNQVLRQELDRANDASRDASDTNGITNSINEADDQEYLIGELQRKVIQLQAELDAARKAPVYQAAPSGKPDYFEQLRQAQSSLLEHNQKINQLLGNIDIIKEKEEKQREILRDNEELYAQLDTLRGQLGDKEKEIKSINEKAHLTREMTSMLDNAYNEFNVLQDKMQKMESQLTSSKRMNMEMEDLKEAYTKMNRDIEEQRQKISRFQSENQELRNQLTETEDDLRETSFQKQQLQKRVAYLEELNNDLQVVSDANKKLESQLRKVGELESKLNVVSEERDQLMRDHHDK